MVSRNSESARNLKISGTRISARTTAAVCVVLLLMTVAACSQVSTKSSASVENSQLFIPASAHVSGALGTNWRTDLEIFNPGQAQASVTVALLKAGTSNTNPQTKTYSLDPGESIRFEDALNVGLRFRRRRRDQGRQHRRHGRGHQPDLQPHRAAAPTASSSAA